jgi:hypothetical protein
MGPLVLDYCWQFLMGNVAVYHMVIRDFTGERWSWPGQPKDAELRITRTQQIALTRIWLSISGKNTSFQSSLQLWQ